MTRTLLIGSGNVHKAAELADLLQGLPWTVKSLRDFPAVEEPEETGETFEDNALLKARYYASHFNVACVADDSGLEVDALNGQPGVYSARYAGENCTYDDNNRKLLAALEGVPTEQRRSRFVCCAALATPNGHTHVVRGTVEGHIAGACRGHHGFGYDPLFVPDNYDRTYAEMSTSEKQAMSHRAKAFEAMRTHLEALE